MVKNTGMTPLTSEGLRQELTRRSGPYINKIRSMIRCQPDLLAQTTVPTFESAIPIVLVCTGDQEMYSSEDRTQLIQLLAAEGMKNDVCGPSGRGGLLLNLNEDQDIVNDPVTCFHMLVGKNDVSTLKALAEMEPPLLRPEDVVQYNLLHLASSCGHIEVVKCLLRTNPHSLAFKNFDGNYPIHISAMKGHTEVFKLLLQRGRSLNFGGEEGFGGLFVKRSCKDNRAKLTALDSWIIQSPREWDRIAPSLRQTFVGFPLLQRTICSSHFLSRRFAIKSLILHFDCTTTRDHEDKLPLHVAAERGLKWTEGLKEILESNLSALKENDRQTNLPPFILAATANNSYTQDLSSIFELLRHNPESISQIYKLDGITRSPKRCRLS